METNIKFCSKCECVCGVNVTACPVCKRTRSVRDVKELDMIFLMKTSEFEASELDDLFEKNAVVNEIRVVKSSRVSSVYDSEFIPTDKNIYVAYKDYDRAKELTFKEEKPEEAEPPTKKQIIKSITGIILFMLLIALVTLGTDAFTGWLKTLF